MTASSHELTMNWITKAENDLKIGTDEMRTDRPVTDMVCYHMQQCAEKYLKAFLVFHNRPFRWTHDIAELIEQCNEIDQEFEVLYQQRADSLTAYGTEIRYPDEFYTPTMEETEEAVEVAIRVREFVREKLEKAGCQAL